MSPEFTGKRSEIHLLHGSGKCMVCSEHMMILSSIIPQCIFASSCAYVAAVSDFLSSAGTVLMLSTCCVEPLPIVFG